jgi:DNA-directed RNA polymerase subunit RPC12/RpoP
MHDDDDDAFDQDWNAAADDLVDCPECGAKVFLELNDDRCPQCGHWFLESDRARMRQQLLLLL